MNILKKLAFPSWVVVFLCTALSSLEAVWSPTATISDTDSIQPNIEFRVGAFYHVSELFRDIYGTLAPCYEIEAGLLLDNYVEIWANFDWSPRNGNSIGLDSRTESNIYNLSGGIKIPFYILDYFTPYLGFGLSIAEISLKNKSACCDCTERVNKFAPGMVVKSGLIYRITSNIFLDAFVDYLYQPVYFAEQTIDIGGVKAGIGIGFNL